RCPYWVGISPAHYMLTFAGARHFALATHQRTRQTPQITAQVIKNTQQLVDSMKNRVLLSIALCFLALETAFYFINQSNPAFNLLTLTVGNALMALLCVITFFIVKKQIDRRPEAFVRGVYGATLLKLMVC